MTRLTRPRRPKVARPRARGPGPGASPARSVATLRREVARLRQALRAEQAVAVRKLAALRRAGDRRLAAMMAEIARLRHHEARAEALERLVAERDASLAAQAARIAELESRPLRTPTDLG